MALLGRVRVVLHVVRLSVTRARSAVRLVRILVLWEGTLLEVRLRGTEALANVGHFEEISMDTAQG